MGIPFLQPVISSLLAATLVVAPQLAAAQPGKAAPSPAAAAKPAAAAQVLVYCPYVLPATVAPPKGFSEVNGWGGLRSDEMFIEDGALYCIYGSYTFQHGGKNCHRASGMWDQYGSTCTQPGRDVQSLECYAHCDP